MSPLPYDGLGTGRLIGMTPVFTACKNFSILKGQQCENCHGPGARHNELEAKWKQDPKSVKKEELEASRHLLHRTVEDAKKTLCYRCHDLG